MLLKPSFILVALLGSLQGLTLAEETPPPANKAPTADLKATPPLPAAKADAGSAESEGFKPLFDSKTIEGWKNPYTWGEIKVVDGEIHLSGEKKFFLVTEKSFKNFIFEGEVKIPEGKANSGFMFRCHVEPNKVFGYQAECDGSDRKWSGGLYDEGRREWLWPAQSGRTKDAEALKHEVESKAFFAKPEIAGALKRTDWNQYRITCQGDKIKIELNGVLITDYKDSMDAEGPIGIQHHGEKDAVYAFRNLRIKELP